MFDFRHRKEGTESRTQDTGAPEISPGAMNIEPFTGQIATQLVKPDDIYTYINEGGIQEQDTSVMASYIEPTSSQAKYIDLQNGYIEPPKSDDISAGMKEVERQSRMTSQTMEGSYSTYTYDNTRPDNIYRQGSNLPIFNLSWTGKNCAGKPNFG